MNIYKTEVLNKRHSDSFFIIPDFLPGTSPLSRAINWVAHRTAWLKQMQRKYDGILWFLTDLINRSTNSLTASIIFCSIWSVLLLNQLRKLVNLNMYASINTLFLKVIQISDSLSYTFRKFSYSRFNVLGRFVSWGDSVATTWLIFSKLTLVFYFLMLLILTLIPSGIDF